jgi:hypothetical protein
MIRFVDLKDQINSNVREFAFYSTISDVFISFSGSYTWDCIECFKNDMYGDSKYNDFEPNNYLNKIPKRFKIKCQYE